MLLIIVAVAYSFAFDVYGKEKRSSITLLPLGNKMMFANFFHRLRQ